jgi:signal transduction histidine kinase
MDGRALGGLRSGSALCWHVAPQRRVERAGVSASVDSRLERHHAFCVLFRRRLVIDGISQLSLPSGANSGVPNRALRAEMEERKRLEQAKLQGERLAVVGSMAAQVAHEIRNPLGSISLNLDLVERELSVFANSNGSSANECRVLLHEMRSQVSRIRQVLQEYLRFARMPQSARAAVSLKGFLEEKLNFLQPLLDQKHVDLRRTLDPNLPPVCVDAEQLWEAVLNLIRNALDAMPDGGNLTVTAQRHGAEALISVSDNGRGMTEEEARHLFVPFFTTKSDGTGLGLAYTQRVINEHGGRIDCATARGKGSTFSIQLPLAFGT